MTYEKLLKTITRTQKTAVLIYRCRPSHNLEPWLGTTYKLTRLVHSLNISPRRLDSMGKIKYVYVMVR